MARSVEDIRQESERNRAQLTATVELLRYRIKDAAEDIRYKVSPAGIKSEVSGFVADRSRGWLAALKQQAMDNPVQALAAGTAVAVPMLRLARGFPLPLLMIGAGLALSSRSVRESAAQAAAPILDQAKAALDTAAGRLQDARDDAGETLGSAGGQLADRLGQVTDTASSAAENLKGRVDELKENVSERIGAGVDTATELARGTIERVRATATDTMASAPAATRQLISDNAVLIGGLGLAIGALVAACMPSTKVEATTLGRASGRLRQAAADAAQSGFDTAKNAALSAMDAASQSVADADLGDPARRMTQTMADTLKTVTEDVVTTAFEPSDTGHQH